MKKQVVIVGLGRFGISLARSLSASGHDVMAVDTNERRVQSAEAEITHAIQADATDEIVLNELGVRNFDIAVVAIGSDIQSSVLSTILLKRLGLPYVIARANNTLHGDILSKIGADKVVFPESDMGDRLAHEIRLGNVSDYLRVAPGFGVTNVEARPEFVGQTLAQLGVGPKGKDYVAALLIRRENEVIVTPSMSEVVKAGDTLTVSGSDEKLADFMSRITAKGR